MTPPIAITERERRVLRAIRSLAAEHRNPATGRLRAQVSRREIAEVTGDSPRTVTRALSALTASGLIVVEAAYYRNGGTDTPFVEVEPTDEQDPQPSLPLGA